ncbi:hypothetical protein [Streptomyces sp. NBC_00525]|uniref:hypothetical protein n=1 Tax=Streptomyces sp. NBC_00525 TaxID=2903660 RepID=UPI002E80B123|nr:hypothetical protein [Streptomyces sp. NBC_00525]WUC95045.1 hypothetical protein OG710_16290 [Streptomyces sp. NBC_00525]
MNPDAHVDEAEVGRESGTSSLVLGVAAVTAYGSPFLTFLPPLIRSIPVYLGMPLGICAIVFGVSALWGMRHDKEADRRRAWAGIALGTVAFTAPIALLGWLSSVL